MTLEQLLDIARERGIEIDNFPMRELRAVSFRNGWIAMDRRKFSDEIEYKCALAHEIGHCETQSFYNIHSYMSLWEINERQANRWAVERLVPICKLRKAIYSGILLPKLLAKMFDVTEKTIETALELYESQLCRRRY